MPLIVPILLVTLTQILGYIYLDKKGWGEWKWLLFVFFSVVYFFVIMPLYMPNYDEMEIKCAMPTLGVFLAILFIGVGGLVFIHLSYILSRFIWKKFVTPYKLDEK